MSWASAMEHVTFGLALCKSTTIARKVCAQNAQIPALGYRAVQEKEEKVEKPHSLAQVSRRLGVFGGRKQKIWILAHSSSTTKGSSSNSNRDKLKKLAILRTELEARKHYLEMHILQQQSTNHKTNVRTTSSLVNDAYNNQMLRGISY